MLTHEKVIEVLTTTEREVKFCDSVYFEGEVGGGNLLEAINVAIASLKKQVPKKPINGCCSNCGADVYLATENDYGTEYRVRLNYCAECGQAIDWSE